MSPAARDCSTMSVASLSIRLAAARPEELDLRGGQVVRDDDPRPQRVVDVVIDVGHPVHQPHQPPLQGRRVLGAGVVEDPVANRLGQVQPPSVPLQHVHDPKRLAVVSEAPSGALAQRLVERLLADVAERRVAEVVPEADRLGQILVQTERPRDRPRDPARLQRVREPRAVVVALRRDEHLGLVLEAAERLRMDDPVAVALERGSDRAVRLGLAADRRVGRRRPVPQVLALPRAHPILERPRGNGWRLAGCAGHLEERIGSRHARNRPHYRRFLGNWRTIRAPARRPRPRPGAGRSSRRPAGAACGRAPDRSPRRPLRPRHRCRLAARPGRGARNRGRATGQQRGLRHLGPFPGQRSQPRCRGGASQLRGDRHPHPRLPAGHGRARARRDHQRRLERRHAADSLRSPSTPRPKPS